MDVSRRNRSSHSMDRISRWFVGSSSNSNSDSREEQLCKSQPVLFTAREKVAWPSEGFLREPDSQQRRLGHRSKLVTTLQLELVLKRRVAFQKVFGRSSRNLMLQSLHFAFGGDQFVEGAQPFLKNASCLPQSSESDRAFRLCRPVLTADGSFIGFHPSGKHFREEWSCPNRWFR